MKVGDRVALGKDFTVVGTVKILNEGKRPSADVLWDCEHGRQKCPICRDMSYDWQLLEDLVLFRGKDCT